MLYPTRNTLFSLMAGLLLAGMVGTANAQDFSAASKAVWDGHLQKAMSQDLDAVMTDFTEQSAILTADKAYVGLAEVRGFLGNVVAGMTPEVVKTIIMQAEVPHDAVVFTKLTIGAAARTFIYTAVVVDGKILTITEADYPAE